MLTITVIGSVPGHLIWNRMGSGITSLWYRTVLQVNSILMASFVVNLIEQQVTKLKQLAIQTMVGRGLRST